jgi:hypothetical protein
VVLNAGFETAEKTRVCYKEDEAESHGRALGKKLAAGTHLVLAHGGPRNGQDDKALQTDLMEIFAKAYLEAQEAKGAQPEILREPFVMNGPYNIIKAGYIMGQADNCKAYICNGEGYGTMDGAVMHIDNREKTLGMFLFKALDSDKTKQREENTKKYHKLGISILTAGGDGSLQIQRHPEEQKTPALQQDAAEVITRNLGLAAPRVKTLSPSSPRPR